MANPKDGGMAFPAPSEHPFETGMSLRDWFAGQALTGILAHPEEFANPSHAAEWAYRLADAMLAARESK